MNVNERVEAEIADAELEALIAMDIYPHPAKEAALKLIAQHKRLVEALREISTMPCLTELLGESVEDNGGCGCAHCTAEAALQAEEQSHDYRDLVWGGQRRLVRL